MLQPRLITTFLMFSALAHAQFWDRRDPNDNPAARQKWFYDQRSYPTGVIPAGARAAAIRRLNQTDAAARVQHRAMRDIKSMGLDAATWTLIGPRPSNEGSDYVTAGRVNGVAIDPRDSNVVYIVTALGGVWKTMDGGKNWTPLTDDQPSMAGGAIVIDPNSPDTIYVGTGEENFSQSSYYGAGLLKSTDAGATWTNIVGPFLRDEIGAIAIQPGNSNVLLGTSNGGVWRSADAGVTWVRVLSGAPGISLAFDPTNGASVYASLGNIFGATANGIYHSNDGGLTWAKSNGSGSGTLPLSNVGRIEVTLAPSNPSILYAQLQNAGASFGALLGIYKSTDSGATWNKISPPNLSVWGTQLWFTNTLRVHPTNPDIVWSGALQIYRTMDGGATWTTLPQGGANGNTLIHVDFHSLAFTADGSKLYLANDGGIYSTTDTSNFTVNWTGLNDTLAVTEFYGGMSLDAANAQTGLAGSQDNGTQRYDGTLNWENVTCGDGGYTALDPAFPVLAYSTCSGISIQRTHGVAASSWIPAAYGIDLTDPTQFISPIVIDPSNPQTLYFGTYRLWQSTDSAGRWNAISGDLSGANKGGTIKAIAIAPSDSDTIYVGTSNARISVTNNANDPTGAAWTFRNGNLPNRVITQIAVDPVDPATAYVTYSGFAGGLDTFGHVFQTTDSGATWRDISGTLPNTPVNDIVIDPDLPLALYIGTDVGVMATTDGGATWSTLGNGLPRAVIHALALQRKSRILRAATFGRSVWDILVPMPGTSVQPAITTLAPNTATVGGGAFTLNVTGSNFTSGSVARWNGQKRPTTFVDSKHLTVQISAADIAAPDRIAVAVFNAATGGGASNSVGFLVGGPPQSNSKAVVSAANPLGGNTLALRSIATIYGVNLASKTAVADLAPPLPSTLGGTTLTMLSGTQTIPLFFVSPGQINFQVPFITTGGQTLTITQGVQSVSIPVQLVQYAPALFTTNAQGTGQASATIANSATVVAPVGSLADARPAKIGEYISIYCTGLGDVSNRPALGSPSPSSPIASTLTKPTVTFGSVPGNVIFSGLAPGFVGLYQVNVQVPDGAPTGPAVPVVLTIGGVTSNTATVAIDPVGQ